jgi:hypothetical protein
LGGNNNLTALDFKYALRRILHSNQLKGKKSANIEPFGMSIGSIFSLVPVRKPFTDPEFIASANKSQLHKAILQLIAEPSGDNITDSAVYYIGGWVVSKLVDKTECSSCEVALIGAKKENCARHLTYKDPDDGYPIFLTSSAIQVLLKTEEVIKGIGSASATDLRNLPINDILFSLKVFFSDPKYFVDCRDCLCNIFCRNHKHGLIAELANRYIGYRLSEILKLENEIFVFRKNPTSRHRMTKIILLRGL